MRKIITLALFLALAAIAGCARGLDEFDPPGTLGEEPAQYGATGKVSFVGPSTSSFSFKNLPSAGDAIQNEEDAQ